MWDRFINATKDGYLWLVDGIEDHPHTAAWLFFAVAFLLLVWR